MHKILPPEVYRSLLAYRLFITVLEIGALAAERKLSILFKLILYKINFSQKETSNDRSSNDSNCSAAYVYRRIYTQLTILELFSKSLG